MSLRQLPRRYIRNIICYIYNTEDFLEKQNLYGIILIGANGAGKSTFLRILSGDLEPTTGEVIIPKEERMSILKQDHFQYDAYTVLDTVMMGNQRLYDVERGLFFV